MTTYNTNLAAEFYVLSMLHRFGADAALTLGNKKAVDIIVANKNKPITTVEVKGLAKAYDWPADNIRNFIEDLHFYVLVSFEGKIADPLFPPSAWIIPSKKLNPFVKKYETRVVISRAKVRADGQQFLHNWSLITG